MGKQTTIDYTRERKRAARAGLPAIATCPGCGRKGAVVAYQGRVLWYDHVVRLEDVGGFTLTHEVDRCRARDLTPP